MSTILVWDKPKRVLTTDQWAKTYGFESGPTGGYMPNMDPADQLSWKAKITGTKLGYPQVEIRKTTTEGSQVLIIVNLGDGYNYKQYRAEADNAITDIGKYMRKYGPNAPYGIHETREEAAEGYMRQRWPTRGINVHISTNGPIQMTFDELSEMNDAIAEAKLALQSMTAPSS